MGESCCRAAEQVENRKPDRAHSVLDVVAENPKGPHIGYDMEPAAVQELMRQNRPKIIDRKADGQSPIGMGETRWDKTEQIKELLDRLVWQSQLEEKHHHIDKNQCPSGHRCGATRNRIFNRKHLRLKSETHPSGSDPLVDVP